MTALTAAVRAELFKLTRRRVLLATLAAAAGLGLISPLGVFLAAQDNAGSIGTGAGQNPSLAELADAGGATGALGVGVSFVGASPSPSSAPPWPASLPTAPCARCCSTSRAGPRCSPGR